MPTPADINNIVIQSSKAFAARFGQGMEGANPDYIKVVIVSLFLLGVIGYGWLGDFPNLKE